MVWQNNCLAADGDIARFHLLGHYAMHTTDAQPADRRTILYVEDNAANLELVERLIARRPDLRMISANTGELGLTMAVASLPAVVLMDINLPGMTGQEVMSLMRANPATAHIPVMALSSNAFPGQIEHGLAAGFSRYLTKPYQIDVFMQALDACLEQALMQQA